MREPTDREIAVLDALVKVARPIILTDFSADSCIASTRIGLDVLTYFGISGEELALTTLVLNREAVTLLHEGMTMNELGDLLRTIPADRPGGPWTLGIGAGAGDPRAWSGHLVISVPVLGAVVDLSIDQGARPHKNIDLEPYWGVIEDIQWWKDGPDSNPVFPLTAPDGTVILLDRRVPDPTGYRLSPNWKRNTRGDKGVYRTLTGRIIREVRDLVR